MAKKTRKNKNKNKNKKSPVVKNNKNDNKDEKMPVVFPFKDIKTIKSFHEKPLNACFLSSTQKYIITIDPSFLIFLDPINFKILSKYGMPKTINFLVELSDKKLLVVDFYKIFVYEVLDNCLLKIIYSKKNKNLAIGCGENKDGTISVIYSDCVHFFKREIGNKIKYYDELAFGRFVPINYEGEYQIVTQFKNGFVFDDKVAVLTYQEIYIFDCIKKNLLKKLEISKENILLKFIKLSNLLTLIYYKKKLVLLDTKNVELINQFCINNKDEEITSIEKIESKNVIIFGTNMGKVKVYDYKRMNIIKEISLNPKKFNVSLIKELENNLIVCNSPQNKIIFIDYVSGNIQAELNLKNSSYYRKGVYLQQQGKLLLCCAKNFAIISK
jgi:WD40 repeat protein